MRVEAGEKGRTTPSGFKPPIKDNSKGIGNALKVLELRAIIRFAFEEDLSG